MRSVGRFGACLGCTSVGVEQGWCAVCARMQNGDRRCINHEDAKNSKKHPEDTEERELLLNGD